MNETKPTKGQIDRAGRSLVNPSGNETTNQALAVLNSWRSLHTYPINTFQATLRKKLKTIAPNSLVAQRLKRTPTIIKKLQINEGMALSRMQDIGGLRAIVDDVIQVRKVERSYENSSKLNHILRTKKDYIRNPKDSGYRGIHLIYQYRSDAENRLYDGLLIELQIRTLMQHAWATSVETVELFLNSPLKSSIGPTDWLDFFKILGSCFAYIEQCPISSEFRSISIKELFDACVSLGERISVVEILQACRAVASIPQSRKVGYYLLSLDTSRQSLVVKSYSEKNYEKAYRDYSNEERQLSLFGPHNQVVLVSASSIEALKKSYPNYFLNNDVFIAYYLQVVEFAKRV